MLVTSIGSLPFTEVDKALDLVFECCPEIPFCPQLPKRSFFEGMYPQCLEGVPAVVIDEQAGTVYMDTRHTAGIERFYDDYYNKRLDAVAFTDRAAPGLYRLLDRLGEIRETVRFIKVQLTGPFTVGLGVKDENGKPIIYDSAYFDIIKKGLQMKAQWMVKALRARFPEKQIILFFDEPAMVSFGSAFVSVSREDVIAMFNEVTEGVDAVVGIHCCGNTDWSALLNARISMVNYDAFALTDAIFRFSQDLSVFLNRKGSIAPGIVPASDEALHEVTVPRLVDLWGQFREHLSRVQTVRDEELLVTTACGLGSTSDANAVKALHLLRALSDAASTR